MIKIEKVSVAGFEPAIRGMRNPKNSWAKSDSHPGLSGDEWSYDPGYIIGPNDKKLAISLAKGGSVHAKYRRQIVVWCDITAPLYWWKEFDTYKVGTVANSCSTMHKIHSKEFTIDDFSHELLFDMHDEPQPYVDNIMYCVNSKMMLQMTIESLNGLRENFVRTNDRRYWYAMIQLLPTSYNQKRTVTMSYENLASMECYRHNHKLDEWREFCKWAETLPYSWIFTTKPAREESVTYDDVEAWLDKHSKDLTPENRELLIEMLQDTGD